MYFTALADRANVSELTLGSYPGQLNGEKESYPCAKMQSAYSPAPADWACRRRTKPSKVEKKQRTNIKNDEKQKHNKLMRKNKEKNRKR